MLEQEISPNAYPLGLSWRVPAEVAAQNTLRLQLSKSLSGLDKDIKAKPEAMSRLRDWLNTLPVTGRVPVAMPDASWLQVNPARDPVLRLGHKVVLPQRPSTVTVITSQGERCMVTHVAGHEASDYLEACDPAGAARADYVWIAQPDGRVQRYGVAMWNREAQDEPAPGAWIWGPRRDGGWSDTFSQRLAMFLATQGPALDPVARVAECDANVEVGKDLGERGREAEGFRLGPPSPSPSPSRGGRGDESSASSGRGDVGNGEKGEVSKCSPLPSRERGGGEGVVTLPPGAPPTRSRGLQVTTNDWGGIGLLQTPTARMEKAGYFAFTASRTYPYTQGNIFVHPLDWLEAGFRYTAISNRFYDTSTTGVYNDQNYKDKSIDVKFRLWPESAYVPQIAAGIRDVAGTGFFSGEYLVANKRTGDFDWSLGMGWGYVGARGGIRNPLGRFNSAFDTRSAVAGQGGQFAFSSYFRGPAALFGGVQYQTPWERLIVKLERDGNDFQHEPLDNNRKQDSPWNVGLVYRAGSAADITLGFQHGNTFTLGLTLHTQLDGLSTPKLSDPPRVAVAATRPQQTPDWSKTASEIKRQSDWQVHSIEQRGNELRVTIDAAEARYWREKVDRVAAVLHRDAPSTVDRFAISYRVPGVEMAEHVIERDAWVMPQTEALPPGEKRESVIARAPEPLAPGKVLYTSSRERFESGLGLGYGKTLGGPDGFVLHQIFAVERAKLWLRDDTWLQGALQLRLIDNYDKFKVTGLSGLPSVRTYLREYLTTSYVTMPNLQLTHVGKLSDNQYYSAYGGYLEYMFAGVGGEWLYRPFESRVAFGVDVNEVWQRDFRQNFGFRDAANQTGYHTATGHVSLYWDTGFQGVQVTVNAGRYLAKDVGATLQLARIFKNGVSVGAFATKTDASAAQFGEGSFDKGVFLTIPFDVMLTRSTNTVGSFVWKPLTRDGGAMLGRAVSLYGFTRSRDDRNLKFEAAPRANDNTIPSDRREAWEPKAAESDPYTRVTPKPTTAQWEPGSSQERRLIEVLYKQQFRNIKVSYDGSHRLTVALANDRLQPASRAVGRAARTALRFAPIDAREIRITYAQRTAPAVTYDFFDLPRLERYFSGTLKASELAEYVAIEYLNPAAREDNPLAQLADLDSQGEPPVVAALLPETFSFGRVWDDVSGAARAATDANWLQAGAYGAGLVLASSVLDSRASTFAQNHAANSWLKGEIRLGNAVPWLGLAGAGLAALDGSDPRRSRTGYAAVEAGGAALLATTGLKYAVGRARPEQNTGSRDFKPFSSINPTSSVYDSFPSGHTMVAWAVATPFALEYNAPWLYGVAGLTNLARVGSNKHWVSDAVASSLLGYGIGRLFWESARAPGRNRPNVLLTPSGVKLSWDLY